MWDMTHSYVGHDSFTCTTRHTQMRNVTCTNMRHDTFMCVTWHIHMGDMTHSYLRHDSFKCVTWHIHIRDTARPDVEQMHSYVHNILKHAAMHCNALQHTTYGAYVRIKCATWRIFMHCNTLKDTAMHCNTLQRTATHYSWYICTHQMCATSHIFMCNRRDMSQIWMRM